MTPGRLVRSLLRYRWATVVAGSSLAVLHQTSELLVPVVIGAVVDRALVTGDGSALLVWLGVLAALFAVLAAAGFFGYFLLDRGAQWVAHRARVLVVTRVMDARGGVEARPGELVRLAGDDAEAVADVLHAVGLGAGAIAALAGGAAILLTTSATLGAVILVGLPLVVILIAVLSRPLAIRIESEQTAAARAAGVAADLLRGLRPLKGLGADAAAADRYRRVSRRALAARVRSARFVGGYEGAALTISGVFLVVVAWVGGRLAVAGDITTGELVAAVGLAQFLVAPLQNAAGIGAMLAVVRAAARRITTITAAPPGVADVAPTGDTATEEDRVSHSPDAASLPLPAVGLTFADARSGALDSLRLDVVPGELLGVVAPPREAADLLALLARDVDPAAGQVCLDGVPVTALSLARLRAAVLVAPHDAVLFSGSVTENVEVAAARPGGSAAALAAAAVDRLSEEVPGGLAAVLGESGRSLSGGQRQRVALARALAVDPPVLVLHDPTTAVDAATEAMVARGIARLRRGRTTVVVTDSPALLAVADRVAVLRGGRVAVTGTHAGLLATDRGYREAVLS